MRYAGLDARALVPTAPLTLPVARRAPFLQMRKLRFRERKNRFETPLPASAGFRLGVRYSLGYGTLDHLTASWDAPHALRARELPSHRAHEVGAHSLLGGRKSQSPWSVLCRPERARVPSCPGTP